MRSRQIEHRERTGAERLDLGEWFLLGTLADTAGGTNPNRAGVFHYRQQRGRQPARHGLIGFAARNAIRNDNEVHGSLLLGRRLTAIHQYGSFEDFDELKLNSDRAEWNRLRLRKRNQLMQE
jgi:hypothetical protein